MGRRADQNVASRKKRESVDQKTPAGSARRGADQNRVGQSCQTNVPSFAALPRDAVFPANPAPAVGFSRPPAKQRSACSGCVSSGAPVVRKMALSRVLMSF